ncbi:MarR family winged helix-turn-helix transcriptional regulator [Marinomonas mediterranea]|uniref:Transcriptional regulator, MarR family n=1 Tax=Marinomonas mediterranea (strain ATCC 700492 / JCM 21426 / NBRC 103028 / MMB-1) TaxID=717774 RepID=F2JUW7_MARM1|nr:MarR family transcriptional regulator [Marinomonas mediterranea]ADZ91621.1 transcriptional regulator, MarR family [Marinomonas mediterranea MMB-1]WCN17722.1 MarR family transcriptional regulator [Marinomonas mediterranea MMB-1]
MSEENKLVQASENDGQLDLDNQLCFALYSASLAMNKLYRKMLKPLDITYSQYLVLLTLWKQDALSVTDIGEQLFLDSATLTPLLKRMESANLIERRRSEQDERHVIISLTEEGRLLKEKAKDIPNEVFCHTNCDLDTLLETKANLESLRKNLLSRI